MLATGISRNAATSTGETTRRRFRMRKPIVMRSSCGLASGGGAERRLSVSGFGLPPIRERCHAF
jgi:hypothetical protein